MADEDEQDCRIEAIVGDDEDLDFHKGVKRFFKYLKAHLQLPCEVTGIEDFRWEEPYILGGWDRKEYQQLKKTQPSYTERFELEKIKHGTASEWMLYQGEDIAACVRRISDGREFILGLAEMKAIDKASPNYQLLDDYACWFVNSR